MGLSRCGHEELFNEWRNREYSMTRLLCVVETSAKIPMRLKNSWTVLVQQVVPVSFSVRGNPCSPENDGVLNRVHALGSGGLTLGKENLLRAFRAGVPLDRDRQWPSPLISWTGNPPWNYSSGSNPEFLRRSIKSALL
jgi:hypothetical protein